MSYTLVIVDMQKRFSASNNPRVRKNCKLEIICAINSNASIIFVETVRYHRTISSLTHLADKHVQTYIVRKDEDDGSEEVVKIIKAFNLPNKRIRICGVNTDQCVLDTMLGINEKMKRCKIELVGNACNSEVKQFHHEVLKEFKKNSNISVV